MNNSTDNVTPEEQPDDTYCGVVAAELAKLLLREPKDLAVKYKGCDPPSHASGLSYTIHTSENIVREHELQILFRMEILRSKVGASIEESTKQKIVKQICSLLETVQYHLVGGFFGDVGLDAYVGKTIKNRFVGICPVGFIFSRFSGEFSISSHSPSPASPLRRSHPLRYSHCLGDVVRRIYTRMDLLLFDDQDGEAPGSLLNSEDSDQPWRDKLDKNKVSGNARGGNESTSAEDEFSSQPLENDNKSPRGIRKEEHAHRLIEAQHMRDRAKRFASFTSWVPDLQRVWAPKQSKAVHIKSESLAKLLKRKERSGASYDVVCETPMTEKKRSRSSGSSIGDEKQTIHGINSCGSVMKALFQEDGDARASTIA
ncbi:hypothetical protein HHK36_027586 [Tetracentron sinense]|uniref:Uncharacterized protein n=1 Tax=Tetracentron sinense TaxID=13715 RepID=A0A834YJE8_TETSI|nr:hypothetical protein HHK36_027586 [Tetracentron sinense]